MVSWGDVSEIPPSIPSTNIPSFNPSFFANNFQRNPPDPWSSSVPSEPRPSGRPYQNIFVTPSVSDPFDDDVDDEVDRSPDGDHPLSGSYDDGVFEGWSSADILEFLREQGFVEEEEEEDSDENEYDLMSPEQLRELLSGSSGQSGQTPSWKKQLKRMLISAAVGSVAGSVMTLAAEELVQFCKLFVPAVTRAGARKVLSNFSFQSLGDWEQQQKGIDSSWKSNPRPYEYQPLNPPPRAPYPSLDEGSAQQYRGPSPTPPPALPSRTQY